MPDQSLDRQASRSSATRPEPPEVSRQQRSGQAHDSSRARDENAKRTHTVDSTWTAFERRAKQEMGQWRNAAQEDQAALVTAWGLDSAVERALKAEFQKVIEQAEQTRAALDNRERAVAVRQLAERQDPDRARSAAGDLAERQKAEREDLAVTRQTLVDQMSDARRDIASVRQTESVDATRTVDEALEALRRHAARLLETGRQAEQRAGIELRRTDAAAERKRADREADRVTPIPAVTRDAGSATQMEASRDAAERTAALHTAVERARAAVADAAMNAEAQTRAARDDMARRHDREARALGTLRPADRSLQQRLEATQRRERQALSEAAQALEREIQSVAKSIEYESEEGRHTDADRDARRSALADLEAHARSIALQRVQAVRESNLVYDFDHWQPQSRHRDLANKASNLGFMTADENRRKADTEFARLPAARDPASLKQALEAGETATRQLVSEMLGSRRFSEVAELNTLWQRASRNEKRSYQESQRSFRQLLGSNNVKEQAAVREAAETVRKALAIAGVEILRQGESFKLRLDDTAYRR